MIECYEDLANAIIICAYEDYKDVHIFLGTTTPPFETDSKRVKDKYRQALETKAEIEGFFMSDWYHALTSVNADIILKKARKEAKHYERKRIS